MLLHDAIGRNNWPVAAAVLAEHGATAGAAKNPRGSTPLMLAADGKCGKHNSKLVEALLADGNGGAASAAERNRKGRTAADVAAARGAVALSIRLRSLEQAAAGAEKFGRCPRCATKLRARSRLAYLRDRVARGEEANALVLELFREHPSAVDMLDVPALHRVNCCLAFRKELTESMALISELKQIRRRVGAGAAAPVAGIPTSAPASSWRGWHLVDLCSGAQCVTAALCLSILPGVAVTALDIIPSQNLPHFQDVGWIALEPVEETAHGSGSGSGGAAHKDGIVSNINGAGDNSLSSFSYMQRDIHDVDLAEYLRSHIGSTGGYSGDRVVVLAMHCCGALSRRALGLFRELDAAAVLLMPCCLPPKAPCGATSWNPNGPTDGAGAGDAVAMADIFATSDQDEQYRRWASYLRQCAVDVDGIGRKDVDPVSAQSAATNAGEGAKNSTRHVVAELREVDAVLSARNTLITAVRIGSALDGAGADL